MKNKQYLLGPITITDNNDRNPMQACIVYQDQKLSLVVDNGDCLPLSEYRPEELVTPDSAYQAVCARYAHNSSIWGWIDGECEEL